MWNIEKRFADLGSDFYSLVKPTPLEKNLRLVHFNYDLATDYGLTDISLDEWLQICSGHKSIDGYDSLASCYMGHQFGVPVAQLGDGRAILIAEQQYKEKVVEFQLKGTGPTPYSRRGDGRAVLRSSIREYLVSHAMHCLGVPTTQAIIMVTSDDYVIRETKESASIVLRTAESFIRFGHFEYYALHGKLDELKQLINFVVENYYPLETTLDLKKTVQHLLTKVVQSTAITIAKWQSIGFVHGVMNTDNMSILGLTIDYGPYAFMDSFKPRTIYNHSDSGGRYTYANQPQIAWWNLYRLAESFIVFDEIDEEDLQPILDSFANYYNNEYKKLMWSKLGIQDVSKVHDVDLIDDILQFLEKNEIDYTYFWRKISFGEVDGSIELIKYYTDVDFTELWLRIRNEQSKHYIDIDHALKYMQKVNPAFILRNHLLQGAIIKALQNDFSEVDKLFNFSSYPYAEQCEDGYYYDPAPRWSKDIVLSCSS